MSDFESVDELKASWEAEDAHTARLGRPLTEAELDTWRAAWNASRVWHHNRDEQEIAAPLCHERARP